MTTVVLLAVLLLCPDKHPYAQSPIYDWQSWGAVTDTLRVTPGKRMYLSSPFVVAESETVRVYGRSLARAEYEINYQRGLIRIISLIPENTLVEVSYTRLPFLLSSVYSLRDVEVSQLPGDRELPPAVRASAKPTTAKSSPDLVFGGVKSISFSVGTNRSTTLDQTLRATVEGNLTQDIRVKALLSDNNLPIQPEGNTEELEYLDKVYVEFTGPSASATLGDFSYENAYSDFSAFRRELKGASAKVAVSGNAVGAAAGSAKGVFRTLTFRGTEQLQGPYELLPGSSLSQEVVIAGTERVYFDGMLLQRGQNRDYTIDYDNGTISFTPGRLVTADTEIAVDFEVTQEQYDRTSAFGTASTERLPGGFTLQAMVAREKDDSNRPKSVAIDEDDREILEGAGDDPDAAIAGGAKFVGRGNGEYIRLPADSLAALPDRYEFNDSIGDFDVSFVEVKAGGGDYVLDSITAKGRPVFRFVGLQTGNYVVGRRLPLPQLHDMITTRLASTGGGRLIFDLQYNVSDFDANTLSTLDDDNNIGDAGELRLGFSNIPVGIGALKLQGTVSTVEENFRSLEKTRGWYFYKDWNLEGVPLEGRELLTTFVSSLTRGSSLRVDYEIGAIDRANFDGVKNEARLLAREGDDRSVDARAFLTDVSGRSQQRTRRHGTASARYGVWDIVPSISVTAEEFQVEAPAAADTGIAYQRYTLGLAKRKADRFSYTLQVEQRETQQVADTTDGWVDTRRDRTFRVGMASMALRYLQGELQYSHRIQDDLVSGGRQTSDLARLKGALLVDRLGMRSNFDYEVSQNQFRSQRKAVVFVGEGQGDYNALGEPVGKGRGDHTVVFLPTTDTTPTHSVALTLYTTVKSARLGVPSSSNRISDWLRANVSFDQSLSIREETTYIPAYKVYLLFPSAIQRDDATLAGVVSLRQEWSLLNGYPNWALAFRYQRDDEEENRFNDVKENRFSSQALIRIDHSLSQMVSVNAEAGRESRIRSGRGLPRGVGSTYDVGGWKISAGLGLRSGGGSTIDGEIEARRQRDAESEAQETAWVFRPRFVWRIARSVSVFGRYEATQYTTEDNGVRPFFFSNTGTTHRWGVTPNLKLSQMITVLATYEGRSEDTFSGSRVTEHAFKIETRAFF